MLVVVVLVVLDVIVGVDCAGCFFVYDGFRGVANVDCMLDLMYASVQVQMSWMLLVVLDVVVVDVADCVGGNSRSFFVLDGGDDD
mmetsp:Transcript_27582/g.58925  ORF Transcript_27582/g.58925 Transcript_27582/m.58925 type:complete len:85 (-) Transcript_27582:1371-1625(-)